MRPSSSDPRDSQSAPGTRPQPIAPEQEPDLAGRRRRAAARATLEPVGAPDPTGPESQPAVAFQATDSRPRPSDHDDGPPHGHVIGHAIGGPPPRLRDANRPFGRIGPYGL